MGLLHDTGQRAGQSETAMTDPQAVPALPPQAEALTAASRLAWIHSQTKAHTQQNALNSLLPILCELSPLEGWGVKNELRSVVQ